MDQACSTRSVFWRGCTLAWWATTARCSMSRSRGNKCWYHCTAVLNSHLRRQALNPHSRRQARGWPTKQPSSITAAPTESPRAATSSRRVPVRSRREPLLNFDTHRDPHKRAQGTRYRSVCSSFASSWRIRHPRLPRDERSREEGVDGPTPDRLPVTLCVRDNLYLHLYRYPHVKRRERRARCRTVH